MATTISVRLEKSMLQVLARIERAWHTDRSEALRRLLDSAVNQWKIESALEQIREHKLSVGKAAEDCKIPLWEMMDLLKKKNIDWTGYTEKDLEKDLKALQ